MLTTIYVDDITGKKYIIQKGRFVEVQDESDDDSNKGNIEDDQNKKKKGKGTKGGDKGNEGGDKGNEGGKFKRSKEGNHQEFGKPTEKKIYSKEEIEEINKKFQKERKEAPVDDDYTRGMSDEDIFSEIKKLKDDPYTAQGLKNDVANVKAKYQKEKEAREKQILHQKMKVKGIDGDIYDFRSHIKRFIKNQIKQIEMYDPNEPDRRQNYFGDAPAVIRGRSIDKTLRDAPSINVYIDMSGSFGSDDVNATMQTLASIAELPDWKKFKAKNLQDLIDKKIFNIYYFGGSSQEIVKDPRDIYDSSTSDQQIRAHILKTKPMNVLICTDADICDIATPPVTVKGGVWIMFRNQKVSQQLKKNIRGLKDNFYGTY